MCRLPGRPSRDQHKSYPKDDAIQAVTMEELKLALYHVNLQNFEDLQRKNFLLLFKVSGRG